MSVNGVGALVFGATIPELFAAQVARTPDAPAAEDASETLTYRQLDTRANNLAHHLQTHGAQPETILAVALPRSIQLITTLLAIAKTGAAYLPIDPNYPSERTKYILTDAAPQLLITDTTTALPHTNTPQLTLDTETIKNDNNIDPTIEPNLQPDNLAFLTYTSGSTGHPKAVMVTHRGVTNLVNQAAKTLPIAGQRVMASTSVAFAFSAFEIFTPLSHGGSIQIAPNALILSRNNTWTAEIISTVPSVFTEILKTLNTPTNHQPHRTKIVVLGGETLPPKLLRQTNNKLPGLTVMNSYGSTETLCATMHPLTNHQPNTASIPIGEPLHNTQMFVLDTQLSPTPTGTAGELYIAGAGLARGYRNQAQLTAQRFIACPFGPAGTRMYRSGDIARWTPNGTLEYIGRADDRIKIHGFRIEPGEIEATLTNHPHIAQAAVTTHTPTHNNADTTDKQLIAYAV
ncbi:MAG: amino acid adenylation domain-containing protein, partial [Mycobacterium sp.]|nr:amino acid adenylation domain-containing protein [Mycobacterium sp.]